MKQFNLIILWLMLAVVCASGQERPGGGGSGGGGTTFPATRAFYVSRWGNDALAGTNASIALATLFQASLLATNYGDVVYLMDGHNSNDLTGVASQNYPFNAIATLGFAVRGVSLIGLPGSYITLTNWQPGVTAHAMICFNSDAHFDNINAYIEDADGDSSSPLGLGISDNVAPVTDCHANNDVIKSESAVLHFEGPGFNGSSIYINNSIFTGNNVPYELKNWADLKVYISGCAFIQTNFIGNISVNPKPYRALDIGESGGSKTYLNNCVVSYSYNWITTQKSACAFFIEVAGSTSNLVANGVTIIHNGTLTANSFDIINSVGTSNVMVFSPSVIRDDGGTITESNAANTYSVAPYTISFPNPASGFQGNFSVIATNRLVFSSVAAFTNTLGREATALLTAGTSVALQDTNGTAIATIGTVATLDVLIPMHVNMRIAGTSVSAILY